MDWYRSTGLESKAQYCMSALLDQNSSSNEIINRAKFFDVKGRLAANGTTKLKIKDSTDLSAIANSSSSVAEAACIQLRYFYPYSTCNVAKAKHSFRTGNIDEATTSTESNVVLTASPNPAQGQVTISYKLPEDAITAKIIFHDMIGSEVANVPVETSAKENSVNLPVSNLKSGIFNYTLYVNGNKIASSKMVVIKE
jgi:hypothetical protein